MQAHMFLPVLLLWVCPFHASSAWVWSPRPFGLRQIRPRACSIINEAGEEVTGFCPYASSCDLGPTGMSIDGKTHQVTFCLPNRLTHIPVDRLLKTIFTSLKDRACKVSMVMRNDDTDDITEAPPVEPETEFNTETTQKVDEPLEKPASDEIVEIVVGPGSGTSRDRVIISHHHPGLNAGHSGNSDVSVQSSVSGSDSDKDVEVGSEKGDYSSDGTNIGNSYEGNSSENHTVILTRSCHWRDTCSAGPVALSIDGHSYITHFCWRDRREINWLRVLSNKRITLPFWSWWNRSRNDSLKRPSGKSSMSGEDDGQRRRPQRPSWRW